MTEVTHLGNIFNTQQFWTRFNGAAVALSVLIATIILFTFQWWTETASILGSIVVIIFLACALALAIAGISDAMHQGGPKYSRARGLLCVIAILAVIGCLSHRQFWTELADITGFILLAGIFLFPLISGVLTAVGMESED